MTHPDISLPATTAAAGRSDQPTNALHPGRTAEPQADIDPDLRGSMVNGYDDDLVNSVLGAISEASGLRLVCVWDLYDNYGVGGNSQFYIEVGGHLHEQVGDLWLWLNGIPSHPDTPDSPGTPSSWIGPATDIKADELPWCDGFHNYAARDLLTHPEPDA